MDGATGLSLPIKGMTYGWGARRGEYRTSAAHESLERLRDTGAEWIALSFWTWQDTVHATSIHFDYGYTVTDRDIAHVVDDAHRLGLKVALKPVVNSRDHIWRAHIGFPREAPAEPYWTEWFTSYRNFIAHYAELADELRADLYCIGCEMVATEWRDDDWSRVIDATRERYSGPLVYNANHGSEEGISWFAKLDFVGTSAYYPVADAGGADVESMTARWKVVRPRLEALHARFRKPILFMEIGCRSALGCAAMPWDFTRRDLPFSEEEQARFYESAFRVFWDAPWFGGVFWWDWSTTLYDKAQAGQDTGFNIYGKEAEQVLRRWYGAPRKT